MQFQFPDSQAISSLKHKWQMYPDVFTYGFSQKEYHEHWESLKDSRYWIVDGMLPVNVSAARYYWEYVTGNLGSWFGFENRCDAQNVRMAAMKLLYFGYLNGFNGALDTSNTRFFHSLGLDETYLQYCKKPCSNDYSSSLQARLIQNYNKLDLPNLPSNYYFGSAYARYNNFENLAKLDPQAIYRFQDKPWPRDVASVSNLCDAAIKGSVFERFTKVIYHDFFIQRIFESDVSLRQEQFSTYIKDMPRDVVFGYLKQSFFDANYLSSLSINNMQYYMKACLIPYCENLISVEANAQEVIRLIWGELQRPTSVIPLLFIYDILVAIIKVDQNMSDYYVKELSYTFTPKQTTLAGSVVEYISSLMSSASQKNKPSYAAEDKKIMDIINALDPLAERSNENVAAYCFKMHVFQQNFNAAEALYNCWKNQNKTEDELKAMFGDKTVALYQEKNEARHVDVYVDVEHGRVSPEAVPASELLSTSPGHSNYSLFSESNTPDLELGSVSRTFGSADHV
jgi:hypothetical protein